MPEFAPILVATDLSHRSDRAVRRAFDLAGKLNRPLIALTVLDDAMPDEMTGPLRDKAIERLHRFMDSLGDGVDWSVRAAVGDPTEEILTQLETVQPSLLVTGVHRSRRFLDMLRETTIQRVVRRTALPVLMVRDPVDHDYGTVLCAMDFSPAATTALHLAAELCPAADIHLLHVVQMPLGGMSSPTGAGREELEAAFVKEARAEDAAWRATTDLPANAAPDTRIEVGAALPALRRIVEAEDVHLVCAGAHGQAGLAPSLLGSVALDLIHDAPCDLLIVRP